MKNYKKILVGIAALYAIVINTQAVVVTWDITGAPGDIITSAGTLTINNYSGQVDIPVDGDPHTFDLQPFQFKSNNWKGNPSIPLQSYTEQVSLGISVKTGQPYTEYFTLAYSVNDGDILTFLNTGTPKTFTSGNYTITLAPKVSFFTIDPKSIIGQNGQDSIQAKLTIVPEPYQYGMVSMLGLIGLAASDRLRHRNLIK